MSNDMVRPSEFGKDFGVVHEAMVTGRKVGADKDFWSKLAHNEALFRRVATFVNNFGKTKCEMSTIHEVNLRAHNSKTDLIAWLFNNLTRGQEERICSMLEKLLEDVIERESLAFPKSSNQEDETMGTTMYLQCFNCGHPWHADDVPEIQDLSHTESDDPTKGWVISRSTTKVLSCPMCPVPESTPDSGPDTPSEQKQFRAFQQEPQRTMPDKDALELASSLIDTANVEQGLFESHLDLSAIPTEAAEHRKLSLGYRDVAISSLVQEVEWLRWAVAVLFLMGTKTHIENCGDPQLLIRESAKTLSD